MPTVLRNPARSTDALPEGVTDRPDIARLRILATSDLHVHIMPWDYHANRPSAGFGLARTASLIAAARAEVACCLLLDNGDFLNGSPLGDVAALEPDPNPMIAAMNALGYDAATLGNHEFSNGLDFLLRQLEQAEFPVISANIARRLGTRPPEDEPLVQPTALLSRQLADGEGRSHPLCIGLIGLAPPQTTLWDREQLGGAIQTRDILEAAAAHVPRLRQAGAEVVIALSHSGIGASTAGANLENASAALAALPGIDAVIAGHTHQTFPAPDFPADSAAVDPARGRLFGKPAVMPGFHGSHLGVIDLFLRRQDDRWQVAGSRAELRPIAARQPTGELTALAASAPAILALAEPAHRATLRWAAQPIGHTPAPLHSFFAMVAAGPTVRLVAEALLHHAAKILAGGPFAGLPVVAAAAPFRAGGRGGPENYTDIAPGPLVMRHGFDLYPHPNTFAALLLTGAELVLWLERSFSQFRQIAPGARDAALLDPDFPSFNFDTLEPLTWQVDLTAPPRCDRDGRVIDPAARRIHGLALHGQPVAPAARFVLATSSYRASGSGGFAGAAPERIIHAGPEANRDILLAHIAARPSLAAPAPANWQFRPLPGTTAIFETAPEAAAFAGDLAPLRAEPLGIASGGFRRFRLHL